MRCETFGVQIGDCFELTIRREASSESFLADIVQGHHSAGLSAFDGVQVPLVSDGVLDWLANLIGQAGEDVAGSGGQVSKVCIDCGRCSTNSVQDRKEMGEDPSARCALNRVEDRLLNIRDSGICRFASCCVRASVFQDRMGESVGKLVWQRVALVGCTKPVSWSPSGTSVALT